MLHKKKHLPDSGNSLEIDPERKSTDAEKAEIQKESHAYFADINALFRKHSGINVSDDSLPKITISNSNEDRGVCYVRNDDEGNPLNIIELRYADQLLNGNYIGEEIGHFYRAKLCPTSEEVITDEFFGWIGRRLLYTNTLRKNETSFLFPRGAPSVRLSMFGVRKTIVQHLRDIRRKVRTLGKSYHSLSPDDPRSEQIMENGNKLLKEREGILEHYRGYDYADKVDLNRIAYWQKLFSMPDAEVRRRFFTDKPDYSGLETPNDALGNP